MIARLRTDDRLRSSVRFAVALVVADAIVGPLFGSNATSVMGAFAVIVHLYFLDFDGTWRVRLGGQFVATAVGAAAVTIGVLVAPIGALAIVVAFLVVFALSMARVLRGLVARSVVGLAAAFFWPVMLPARHGDLGPYLLAWLIGSAVSMVVGLVVLPRRPSARVCNALESWLLAAADLTRSLVGLTMLDESARRLEAAAERLEVVSRSTTGSLGSVGRRQRAIGEMVSRAVWAHPVITRLTRDPSTVDVDLATESAKAFEDAAALVVGGAVPEVMPDLEAVRQVQLERMDGESPAAIAQSYPLRVTSLVASLELWLAAESRGIRARRPDVGDVTQESPIAILRTSMRRHSVWLRAAVMSGAGAAGCLALVRALGIEHGLWVLLAALISFQGCFSAAAGRRRLVASALGAAGGVAIAGVLFLLDPPYMVFVAVLPVVALAAKYAQASKMWVSQFVFTPFVLVNLVVLGSLPHLSLAVERVENIALGALVAAVLTFVVFPVGIGRLLDELADRAVALASSYSARAIERAGGGPDLSANLRTAAIGGIAMLETNLAAGHLATRSIDPIMSDLDRRHAIARECLLAGDVCAFLADRPGGETPARVIAKWWSSALDAVGAPPRGPRRRGTVPDPGRGTRRTDLP